MNADNSHSPDPRPSAPATRKFKRYDMKKLLADPELRRKLIVQGTIATQAREGIDVTEAEVEDSYYVVTQAERAAFFSLVPFRSGAGESDGRHSEFIRNLTQGRAEVRYDATLKDFVAIEASPLSYDKLSILGPIFRDNTYLDPAHAIARQGKATGGDDRWIRRHWEITSPTWVPFAKGGDYSRFYSDIYLKLDWNPNHRSALKASGNGLPSEELYFKPGLTWTLRSQRGFSIRILPEGCVFANKGSAIFPNKAENTFYLLGILNTTLVEYILSALTSFGSYEVGVLKKTPIPTALNEAKAEIQAATERMYSIKATWDTGNEICTRFSRPWVLQPECADGAKTLSAALDQVLRHEAFLDAQLTETYARLNDEVYRLYGVNAELRAKIEAAIGERPPELVWPQMEGKDTDQKRREHVDRLLTYLVKQILTEDEDHLVCLQRVAHEPPLLERLRTQLAACFPQQDPSALETEVVNELKKKTKGCHRAESLSEWLHDVFFRVHNALYQQRPVIWHLASHQTRTEPGFGCLVHAHHFDADALAKLRSVYVKDRITVLRREAAQAGQDGKADLRLDLLALAEEVEAYDAKLAHLQEGAHTGPVGGDRDYRILTPWKTSAARPKGWIPDIDDGIRVNLAPLARTGLLRVNLRLGTTENED